MRMLDVCQNEDLIKTWCKKMAPPLVTLLGAEPEVGQQTRAARACSLAVPWLLASRIAPGA